MSGANWSFIPPWHSLLGIYLYSSLNPKNDLSLSHIYFSDSQLREPDPVLANPGGRSRELELNLGHLTFLLKHSNSFPLQFKLNSNSGSSRPCTFRLLSDLPTTRHAAGQLVLHLWPHCADKLFLAVRFPTPFLSTGRPVPPLLAPLCPSDLGLKCHNLVAFLIVPPRENVLSCLSKHFFFFLIIWMCMCIESLLIIGKFYT